MAEPHPLVVMARAMTGNVETHEQVAAQAAQLEAQIAEALTVTDPDAARAVLPEAVHAVYGAMTALVGLGLVPGPEWFYQRHRQLHRRAVALLGPGQTAVAPCPVEPPSSPARPAGQIFPR